MNDISFEVEKGEIVGFLGPNGAGKSTTMKILTSYLPATSGRATIAGFDVFEQSFEARKRIGYPGQVKNPVAPDEAEFFDEAALVEPMRARLCLRRLQRTRSTGKRTCRIHMVQPQYRRNGRKFARDRSPTHARRSAQERSGCPRRSR